MSVDATVGITLGDFSLEADLHVDDGEMLAVLGPNGAGKSTLLAAVAGLLPLERGSVVLDGEVLEDPAHSVRVAPELVSTGLGTDVRASMLDDLQRAWDAFGASGKFRITQTTVRIPAERALRLIEEIAEKVRDEETDDAEPLVVTAFMHPVRTGSTE